MHSSIIMVGLGSMRSGCGTKLLPTGKVCILSMLSLYFDTELIMLFVFLLVERYLELA